MKVGTEHALATFSQLARGPEVSLSDGDSLPVVFLDFDGAPLSSSKKVTMDVDTSPRTP